MVDYYRYRFRNARDTLIGTLAMVGERMLNHNLPVTTLKAVIPYEATTTICIDYTQPEVTYTLIDDRGWASAPYEGNDGRLEIETSALTHEYHTFSVQARPKGLRTVCDLHQRVTVKVGPEIDLEVNLVKEVIDYGAVAIVRIVAPQPNASYQVFNSKGKAISEKLPGGDEEELHIPIHPLTENCAIKIKTTLEKTRVEDWLIREVTVLVKPNLEIDLSADGNDPALGEMESQGYACAYNHPAKLFIRNSQRSTQYRLRYLWVDADDTHLGRHVTVVDDQQGTGGDLTIIIPGEQLSEDFRLYVQAYKRGLSLGGRLKQELTILVRPDPSKRLSVAKINGTTCVHVNDSQAGVSYQLLDATDLSEIGPPVLHRRNRGVGMAKVGRDFSLGSYEHDRVLLPIASITKTKAYRVRATKVRTMLSVLLEEAITIEVRAMPLT